MDIHYILGYRSGVYGGKRYGYWKANIAVMNAAFHNIKWEEEMETK